MTDSTTNLPAPVNSTPQQPRRLWPLWLIAVIALIAVIGLGLWSWHLWQQQQALQQSLNYLDATTQRLDRDYSQSGGQLRERIQSLQGDVTDQAKLISDMRRQIDHNARTLLEAGNRTRTDWLLAEAEYLLRIANQRLQVEKDYRGALSALKAADDVLEKTDDPGSYPVRKQVAQEILSLKSVAGVDKTGLYLQLEAAIDSIGKLNDSALAMDASADYTQTMSQDPDKTDERGALAKGWAHIKGTLSEAIAIRRLDEPVKPLLSPDQSAYVRLNMRLMLEEAQLAVLRGNQTLYNQALKKATDWLNTWYDGSHSKVVGLRDTLGELSGKDINPELPDISQSLTLLKARLEGRLNATSGETKPADNEKSDSAPTGDKAGDAS
ncbi:uroporphyrinogen-III C-methyltransferase [Marinobacter mangrovi]|uniref:uroporphyrinogen-III C-methyltransferase n=1 Tax=Marinobacter mangrovi TaxID=2803918 RepID=UPI00193331F1|nr:uroporphyrinogen-III C-methyltransferase [Marinobacter mangrovi]